MPQEEPKYNPLHDPDLIAAENRALLNSITHNPNQVLSTYEHNVTLLMSDPKEYFHQLDVKPTLRNALYKRFLKLHPKWDDGYVASWQTIHKWKRKDNPMASRKRFTPEQKAAALKDLAGGMGLKHTAKRHSVSIGSLMKWKSESGTVTGAGGKHSDEVVLKRAADAIKEVLKVIRRMEKTRKQLRKML